MKNPPALHEVKTTVAISAAVDAKSQDALLDLLARITDDPMQLILPVRHKGRVVNITVRIGGPHQ